MGLASGVFRPVWKTAALKGGMFGVYPGNCCLGVICILVGMPGQGDNRKWDVHRFSAKISNWDMLVTWQRHWVGMAGNFGQAA